MKAKPLPTQERLHELFDYSIVTGEFWWREPGKGRDHNKPAGWQDNEEYHGIGVDGVTYKAHRLAWMYVTGEDPGDLHVDHVNGIRDCNAFHNLQLLTHAQNSKKRHRPNSSKTSGLPRGVRRQRSGGYQVQMRKDGVLHNCGTYKTLNEAEWVAVMYGRALHGEYSTYTKS